MEILKRGVWLAMSVLCCAFGDAHSSDAPLATSPADIRKPGGTRQLEDALRSRGYLRRSGTRTEEDLTRAVKRFQEDQHLAATGYADEKTLRQLGLNPSDVDRSEDVRGSQPRR